MRFEWKKFTSQTENTQIIDSTDFSFFGMLKIQGRSEVYVFRLNQKEWPESLHEQYLYFFKILKEQNYSPESLSCLIAARTISKKSASEFIQLLKSYQIKFALKEITEDVHFQIKLDLQQFLFLAKKNNQLSENTHKNLTSSPPKTIPDTKKLKKILIVEDSVPVQKILQKIYSSLPRTEIVSIVSSWKEAVQVFREKQPDFVSLDMNLADGTGIDFLKEIKNISHPKNLQIVLVTDCTIESGHQVLDALALGAQSYIQKPHFNDLSQFQKEIEILISSLFPERSSTAAKPLEASRKSKLQGRDISLFAIGSSTGGTEVVKDLLAELPLDAPPVLVVQHMPKSFTGLYAERLGKQTGRPVYEVNERTLLEQGSAYIASGNLHLVFSEKHGKLYADIQDGPHVNRFKPSVSVLFQSIAESSIVSKTLAIMLTGMGSDGSIEMKELKNKGAFTITQSEESCAVYGMPRAADEIGASCWSASPNEMSQFFKQLIQSSGAVKSVAS